MCFTPLQKFKLIAIELILIFVGKHKTNTLTNKFSDYLNLKLSEFLLFFNPPATKTPINSDSPSNYSEFLS